MRIQGCQMQPASTYDEASWRAKHSHVYMIKWGGSGIQVQAITSNIKKWQQIRDRVNTCISINLNRKTCMENGIESIGTHKHAINIIMDKTSCISSDYGFMGLIRRGDNPNKETLIYIPHISCRHRLSLYNLSCPQGNRTRVSGVIIICHKVECQLRA